MLDLEEDLFDSGNAEEYEPLINDEPMQDSYEAEDTIETEVLNQLDSAKQNQNED